MSFVDFTEVKASITLEHLIERLGLTMTQKGDQWRGPCPACQSGGDRALVITQSKAAFYCFAAQSGGDAIALAAHIRGETMKEAAHWIVGADTPPATGKAKADTVPNERKGNEGGRALKPLTYLEPDHEALKHLGISAETLEDFGAGYAPKGIMRGRLAIPIRDWDGVLIAYVGYAVSDEQAPKLIFPTGFDPQVHLFNADRVGEGELVLARDPVSVLAASENGVGNVICLLTGEKSAGQFRMVAALMEARGCDGLELF